MSGSIFKNMQNKIFIMTLIIVFSPLLFLGYFAYSQSEDLIEARNIQTNLNTLNQIGVSLDFIFRDTNDLSLFVIQSNDTKELLQSEEQLGSFEWQQSANEVSQMLSHLIGSKETIEGIQLQNLDGEILVDTSNRTLNDIDDHRAEIYQKNGGAVVHMHKGEPDYLLYSRLIKNTQNVSESLGFLTIRVPVDFLRPLFSGSTLYEHDAFVLTDYEAVTVTDSPLPNQDTKLMTALLQRTDSLFDHEGGRFRHLVHQLEYEPFSLHFLVSLDDRANDGLPSNIVVVSLLVSLFLCTIAAYLFSRNVVKPVNQLLALMRAVEKGNMNVHYVSEVKSAGEINALGSRFNDMLKQIRFLTEMVLVSQIRNQEAELKRLYSQINPHFLYNTLDTIYWLGKMEGAPRTSEMIYSLSNLFRKMLNNTSEKITVGEEIDHIEHYIHLQKVRYEGLVDFRVYVEEGLKGCATLKLIIQPLLENAILHGIEPLEDFGIISINVYKNKGDLLIEVADNGVGTHIEELERRIEVYQDLQNQSFLALGNIHHRIQLTFGNGYGLSFTEPEHGGLIVTARQKLEVMLDEAHDRGR